MSTARATVGAGDVDIWVFDWTEWLSRKSEEQGTNVALATATWTASEGLDVLDSPPPSVFDSGRQARVWWDAGLLAPGVTAQLTCRVTTTAGHEREASVVFDVRAR